MIVDGLIEEEGNDLTYSQFGKYDGLQDVALDNYEYYFGNDNMEKHHYEWAWTNSSIGQLETDNDLNIIWTEAYSEPVAMVQADNYQWELLWDKGTGCLSHGKQIETNRDVPFLTLNKLHTKYREKSCQTRNVPAYHTTSYRMKDIGKPYEGKLHVRFDEEGQINSLLFTL